jgi:hypothetical protein
MADVLFIAILSGFFGMAVLFVRACAWLIGPEVDVPVAPAQEADRGEDLAA